MEGTPQKLYFLTNNENKFAEVQALLGPEYELEKANIHLPELQEVNARKIVKDKLQSAIDLAPTPLIVDDTSLYLDCLGGLPGPLIKWFMKKKDDDKNNDDKNDDEFVRGIGNEGLAKLALKYDTQKAYARTIIGIAHDKENIKFVEGSVTGTIVLPRGNNSFGWDHIFQPEGETRTYAEMGAEKHLISHRKLAIDALKEYFAQYEKNKEEKK